MTREEQIKKQADIYTDDASNYAEWSDDGWSDTNDIDLVEKAFIEGAKWADSHPSNAWHDASEIPQENHKNIIYQTNYYSMYNVHIDFIPSCLRSCKITQKGWKEFIGENNVKRWAYINDLLPKIEEL